MGNWKREQLKKKHYSESLGEGEIPELVDAEIRKVKSLIEEYLKN